MPIHQVFSRNEIPGDDQKIWRYMNFMKFVSLLADRALYFSKPAQFDDRFEGALPMKNVKSEQDEWEPRIHDKYGYPKWSRDGETIRDHTFISCWHINDYESAALWGLYLSRIDGVAIQSTIGRLKEALAGGSEPIGLGQVEYIDYSTERTTSAHLPSGPFLLKRKSYEHERELRAIIQTYKTESAFNGSMPCDVDQLIENIYVMPGSATWIRTLIKNVTNTYGFDKLVRQSSLDDEPLK